MNALQEGSYKTLAVILPLALLFIGCSKDSEIEPDPSSLAQNFDAGTIDKDGDMPAKQCPKELPGPSLVQLSSPDGIAYCMDRTEVTQRHYFAFLDSLGNLTDLDSVLEKLSFPSFCGRSNMFLTLSPHTPPCDQDAIPSFDKHGNHLDHPIACIGWCAAYAYCAWAGKRLCGAIGGGSLDVVDGNDPRKSQWYNACSQGGTSAYSYGDVFDEDACSPMPNYLGKEEDAILPEVVESRADRCRGTGEGFSEILNLSGSVLEFEDSCVETERGVNCTVRPDKGFDPDVATPGAAVRCDEAVQTVLVPNTNTGFRCCYDL